MLCFVDNGIERKVIGSKNAAGYDPFSVALTYCEDIYWFLIFAVIILLVEIDNLLKSHLVDFFDCLKMGAYILLQLGLLMGAKFYLFAVEKDWLWYVLDFYELLAKLLFYFLILELSGF